MTADSLSLARSEELKRRRERLRSRVDWVVQRWHRLLGIACLLALVALGIWQKQIGDTPGQASSACFLQTLSSLAAPGACEASLRRLTSSVSPDGKRGWAFKEPGWPRLFVWADNFFVAAYTLFFIAAGARTFLALRPSSRTQALALRWLFGLALTTAVLGGLCDYIENFWLLAHIGSAADYSAELASVAAFTAWKFRFFALNLLAVIAWSVAMRCDHRR